MKVFTKTLVFLRPRDPTPMDNLSTRLMACLLVSCLVTQPILSAAVVAAMGNHKPGLGSVTFNEQVLELPQALAGRLPILETNLKARIERVISSADELPTTTTEPAEITRVFDEGWSAIFNLVRKEPSKVVDVEQGAIVRLQTGDWESRRRASSLLGRFREEQLSEPVFPRLADPLLKLLTDPIAETRWAAMRAIINGGISTEADPSSFKTLQGEFEKALSQIISDLFLDSICFEAAHLISYFLSSRLCRPVLGGHLNELLNETEGRPGENRAVALGVIEKFISFGFGQHQVSRILSLGMLGADSQPLKVSSKSLDLLCSLIKMNFLPVEELNRAFSILLINLKDSADSAVRLSAQRGITLLTARGYPLAELKKAIKPTISNLLRGGEYDAYRTLFGMVDAGMRVAYISDSDLRLLITGLSSHRHYRQVVCADVIRTLLELGLVSPCLSEAVAPTIELLGPAARWDVQIAGRELLGRLAERDIGIGNMDRAGLTPASLRYPKDLTWTNVVRFGKVWSSIWSDKRSRELSLGGRALLRQRLFKAASSLLSEEDLTAKMERLFTHALRKEAIENTLDLPSFGAELHLSRRDNLLSEKIQELAAGFMSGIGSHEMEPIDKSIEHALDVRLMPSTPSHFSEQIRMMLDEPTFAAIGYVGAHYSIGADLRSDAVAITLALFFGDYGNVWIPYPKADSDIGFPGFYQYVGQTVDLYTGVKQERKVQSNIHLRPLRLFDVEAVAEGAKVYIPFDTFPRDIESLTFLSVGALAENGTPLRKAYDAFRVEWEQWLLELGDQQLLAAVQAAEEAVLVKKGQGKTDALDQASEQIYVALYQTAPEESPGDAQIRLSLPRVAALQSIVQRGIDRIQAVLIPDSTVRQALEEYRHASDIDVLDAARGKAVAALCHVLIEGRLEDMDSSLKERYLNYLAALDAPLADQIRSLDHSKGPRELGMGSLPFVMTLAGFILSGCIFFLSINSGEEHQFWIGLQTILNDIRAAAVFFPMAALAAIQKESLTKSLTKNILFSA